MNSSAPTWIALFVAGLLTLTAAAVAQRGPSTIGVEDVRPGMRGYGLTVFRGTEPERFDVEVVDVLHQFLPGQDLILARTPHPVLNRAIAVGGMSGSPIYLDGKLAGAYAYGWTFGIEPVIGITPIRSMLAEIDRPFRPTSFPGARPLPERPTGRARAPRRASLGGLPAYVGGRVDAFATVRAHREASVTAPPLGLQPAATPLMLAGFTPRMARVLQEELEPYGLMPMQGGGGQAPRSEGSSPRFVDGGALGVQLIRGDMAATGIGTVTHVDPSNGRLVAFGHPMMNAGESGLPTCTARVLHVFQSVARSFKLAEAIEPYGTLVHDRQPAIVVDRCSPPRRCRCAFASWRRGRPQDRVERRGRQPALAHAAARLLRARQRARGGRRRPDRRRTRRATPWASKGTARSRSKTVGTWPPALATRALSRLRLFDLMEVAYGNPFEASRVTSVDLELDVRYARDVVIVDEAWIATPEVDPGSDVDVRVRLVRYGQESEIRTIRVHVPESAAGETLTLEIEGGNGVDDPTPDPRNVDDLLRIVRQHYPATSLVASLKMPTRGLRFRGHVVQSLPLGALDTLQRTSGSGPGQPFVTYLRRSEDLGQVVAGSTQLRLQVRETPRERATR
ncbi:MAG: hypothetical protein R3B99_01435 [Polyangiales bacterium]